MAHLVVDLPIQRLAPDIEDGSRKRIFMIGIVGLRAIDRQRRSGAVPKDGYRVERAAGAGDDRVAALLP